mgnify:CR=1 FL=1
MAGIAICEYNQCPKKDSCERFQNKQGELMEFKNICTKENNYKWFWESKNNMKGDTN